MKWTTRSLAVLLALSARTAFAQEIAGSWQATLETEGKAARLVLRLAREADGQLSASLFNLDQGGFTSPALAYSVRVVNRTLDVELPRGSYEGVIGANDSVITGTWTAIGPTGQRQQRLAFARPTRATAWRDSSSHQVRFVAVEPNVRLEVLDWGGTGRTIVLLTGAGDNAHVFDQFAPKLAGRYHVLAITRRGFAPSSIPVAGYRADSLADDILAVLDSLRLARPVLIGHSISGEELSSIGSRHADRVAGLVYLDAGFPYALYDPSQENTSIVIPDAMHKLDVIFDRWAAISFAERAAMIRELADTTMPVLVRDLRSWAKDLDAAPNAKVRPTGIRRDRVASALFAGAQKYTTVHGPVLALFAAPRAIPPAMATDSASRAKADSTSLARLMPQIDAFQRGVPQARVVRVPHAAHYVFRSNEADVLREVRDFVDALPATP